MPVSAPTSDVLESSTAVSDVRVVRLAMEPAGGGILAGSSTPLNVPIAMPSASRVAVKLPPSSRAPGPKNWPLPLPV